MKAVAGLSQQPELPALASSGTTEDAATLNTSFLEFLNDELVFGAEALDSATLEAVCKVADGQRPAPCGRGDAIKSSFTSTQPGPSMPPAPTQKRSQEDAGLSDSDDDDEPSRGERTSGKRSRGGEMSAAATKKACREKARREKLNERFTDLARLIDPGSEPKTDKSTILTDAIKYVQQLTVENHQLRQLNKFLEERVSTLERERGQQLYQQSLMMNNMGQATMMSAGQPMMMAGPAGMLAGSGAGPSMGHSMASTSSGLLASSGMPTTTTPPLTSMQSQQQHPHQQQQQSGPGCLMVHAPGGLMCHAPGGMMAQSQGGLMAQQQGGMMVQASASMMTQAPGNLLVQAQGGMMVQGAAGLMSQGPGGLLAQAQASGAMMSQLPMQGGAAGGVGSVTSAAAAAGVTFLGGAGPSKPIVLNSRPGMYPGMYWLPPQLTDSTQDSLLRPPAA